MAKQPGLDSGAARRHRPPGSTGEFTFTLGAVHGAMETFLGRKLRGKQTGSVLRGADHDILEFVLR